MTAVISSTYDSKYLYFLPIVCFTWNKLGVNVICFMPDSYYNFITNKELDRLELILKTINDKNLELKCIEFKSQKSKEITYSQCSRLYAACLEDLPEDEILITSDVDMAVLNNPFPHFLSSRISVLGNDLVPEGQLPICYLMGKVNIWRKVMGIENKTYQQCLDELLGNIDCENMKSNYWSKDQETINDKLYKIDDWFLISRSNGQTQFATKRYDRDDMFLLDKLSLDTIDFHMPRPGFEQKNFDIILKVLEYHYPNDNFQWLIDYTNKFKKLL